MRKEKQRFLRSCIPGTFLVLIATAIYFLDELTSFEFYKLGIYPRSLKGLPGIITSPFIHSTTSHLLSNAVPVIILTTGIRFFYFEIFSKIFLYIWLITNLWIWCLARESYHIGASGLLYAFASFLFFGGLFRKDRPSIALSLLVAFLYGSLFWGIFPFNYHVSWEAHLMGALSGLLVAYHFRTWNLPFKEPEYDWMKEEDSEDSEEENPYWMEGINKPEPENIVNERQKEHKEPDKDSDSKGKTQNNFTYHYIYIPADSKKKDKS